MLNLRHFSTHKTGYTTLHVLFLLLFIIFHFNVTLIIIPRLGGKSLHLLVNVHMNIIISFSSNFHLIFWELHKLTGKSAHLPEYLRKYRDVLRFPRYQDLVPPIYGAPNLIPKVGHVCYMKEFHIPFS